MVTPQIPILDIAACRSGSPDDKQAVAQALGEAFEQIGFATIIGHGIPEDLIQQTCEATLGFFHLPLAQKQQVSLSDRIKNRGYIPMGRESVAATRGHTMPPDLCEALVFYSLQNEDPQDLTPGRTDSTGNLWPAVPPDLKPLLIRYNAALMSLTEDLMRLSALALDLPETYFLSFMQQQRGVLRAVFYPDQQHDPEPGQLRYGAHSDYGGLTILRQDQAPGGLQVCLKSGDWVDVPSRSGAFVINVGDLIARWTNDRWRSTLHRVINPSRDLSGSTQRLSLVYFTGPDDDALIECLPTCQTPDHPAHYAPVRTGDYIRSKLDASMIEAEIQV